MTGGWVGQRQKERLYFVHFAKRSGEVSEEDEMNRAE